MSKNQQINLLPKKEKHLSEKFFYFILHYFRYIVVITQIVVISVFFYRFYIDQKIIDLKEKYKQKQQILVLTLPLVEEAQALEDKTKLIRNILSKQSMIKEEYDYVLQNIHKDVRLVTISYDGASIIFSGNTGNNVAILEMQSRLTAEPRFAGAQITKLLRQKNYTFDFTIKVTLKNGQVSN